MYLDHLHIALTANDNVNQGSPNGFVRELQGVLGIFNKFLFLNRRDSLLTGR